MILLYLFHKESLSHFLSPYGLEVYFKKQLNPTHMAEKLDAVPLINVGTLALGQLADIFLIFIFSIYLLKEGPTILKWISAFFDKNNQEKIDQTAQESAVLFSFSVSSSAALIVFVAYTIYHAIENYLIVPLVYGNRLKVSSFVVLLSLIVAGLLAGIKGAIIALPIAASYAVIERIWLKKYLNRGTVEKHELLTEA